MSNPHFQSCFPFLPANTINHQYTTIRLESGKWEIEASNPYAMEMLVFILQQELDC